jgi:hypothetical protein
MLLPKRLVLTVHMRHRTPHCLIQLVQTTTILPGGESSLSFLQYHRLVVLVVKVLSQLAYQFPSVQGHPKMQLEMNAQMMVI